MKKLFGSLIVVLFALTNIMIFSTPLFALEEGYYISYNMGSASLSNSNVTSYDVPGITMDMEFDTGSTFGIALGYDYGYTRLEGEMSYQKNNFKKQSLLGVNADLTGDVTSFSLLINGYYDFVNNSAFTPYVSAGLGLAKIEINDWGISGYNSLSFSDKDTVFAHQMGVGVGYAITEKVTFDAKYRWFATSNPKFDNIVTQYSNHNFLFGIRANF